MNSNSEIEKSAEELFLEIRQRGLPVEKEQRMLKELNGPKVHKINTDVSSEPFKAGELYRYSDLVMLQDKNISATPVSALASMDELLERDRQREKDGFPRKIQVGRLIKPGKIDGGSIVIVPTTVEEKFMHDSTMNYTDSGESSGTGQGEEGEIIGEQPVRPEQGEGNGAGEGDDASHDIQSTAYDLGRILTEKFELPNLKDRGTRRSLTRYTYDITDKNRGFGQVLDKKATLRKVLQTNFGLGRISDVNELDTTEMIVSPGDKIYRVLSQEKDYESQAMVFFVRDYSGSMEGKCTELVVAQHVLIYSWLLYQYSRRVETRFILHDTSAREVPDFYTYYNSRVAGGTQVAAAYNLVNRIVEEENLAQEYNIYVFHGTDGDDWDTTGEKTVPELKRILEYASRMGITIVSHNYTGNEKTEVQTYLENSGLLTAKSDLLRMDTMTEDADEARLIEGIRRMISQEVL
ncbi:MAG: DUF444 family protein [Fibrobacter sp.]|jgi:uncharacterized sporulation protein YeaH/YhbH (DUF444 family)|nr:DUF444 family protein [Fibrobacter sp.]